MASQANTPDTPLNGEQDGMPQIAALAQYIKDLSVENPSAPQVFQWQDQPQLDVKFNINVNRSSEDIHEVVAQDRSDGAASAKGAHFLVDLSYAGLFGLRNMPEEALGPFLLVEAPRLLFPFARQIVAEAVQNTGFPPLLLDPIDFASAYHAAARAAAQAKRRDRRRGAGAGRTSSRPATPDRPRPPRAHRQ